jgi:formate-dependent nitrite reductase cytochrome c552 subunit
MLGVALVTLAGLSWLFLLPSNIRGQVTNPYIGLLVSFAIPVVFFAGLILIPIGIALARRRVLAGISSVTELRAAWRRAAIFFVVMTLANVVIASQLSYRAVEQMDTSQFCGGTCHVMKPEFTAHMTPPHQAVSCTSCHVAPGAEGWLRAKVNGTRQLIELAAKTYPRPIEGALESNRLVSSAATCEQCHDRERYIGPRLRIHSEFADDQTNTRSETVLMMMVGGGYFGGVHGAHMGPGVRVRYAATDQKRQTIPWVEYTSGDSTRTYVASGTNTDPPGNLVIHEMECADCHNRAAHSFELPERAMDGAMAAGQISPSLPFVKKTAVQLLKANYASDDEAAQRIPAALKQFYQTNYEDVWSKQSNDIQNAGQALAAIYQSNVFPDMKVTWGTYPNNLGHMDSPGCFRCHDDSHASPDKKTIGQDCSGCHQMLAVEEKSPAVLKTLGLDELPR